MTRGRGMVIYVYLFSLVVGGVLLLASMFGGGDAHGHGADDSDAHAGSEAGAFDVFGPLLSLRFWTFFGAFFGLTGLVLDAGDFVGSQWLTLAIAIAVGFASGWGAVAVLRSLQRNTSGEVPTADDYVGKSGRVLVAFDQSGLGKIRVEIGGTTVDVLAKTDDPASFRLGDEALIVQMQEHTAVVARLDRAESKPTTEPA